MKTCAEVQRLLGRYLALELAEEEDRTVRLHLADCPSCRALAATREPSLVFIDALRRQRVEVEDESFVPAVMAAVHQRRLEAQIARRRRRWLAAAAAVVGVLLVGLGTWRPAPVRLDVSAQRYVPQPPSQLPPVVEVEGEDVRLYQLSANAAGEVQVVFIIDPGLEL